VKKCILSKPTVRNSVTVLKTYVKNWT
jgi:hypothetical protein